MARLVTRSLDAPSLRQIAFLRPYRVGGKLVEVLLFLVLCTVVAGWIYRLGKREGSRRGYGAGRAHGRRDRRRRQH
jgi:hypothetical protein